jgi:hypothetical protein
MLIIVGSFNNYIHYSSTFSFNSSPEPLLRCVALAACLAAVPFIGTRYLIHHQLHLLLHFLLSSSPRMRCASRMSFGMIVTRFPCIAHSLVSEKRQTRYASKASWRARRTVLCICKSDLKLIAILQTRRWKGAFLINSSVFFWYLRILQRATVPGR